MAHAAEERAAPVPIPDLAAGRYRTVMRAGEPEVLGRGSYGTVVLAFDLVDGELVAIKYLEIATLDRNPRLQELAEREVANHSELTHPHVCGGHLAA